MSITQLILRSMFKQIDVENYSMQVQGGSIFTRVFGKLDRMN
jgi:hypothetical protein